MAFLEQTGMFIFFVVLGWDWDWRVGIREWELGRGYKSWGNLVGEEREKQDWELDLGNGNLLTDTNRHL